MQKGEIEGRIDCYYYKPEFFLLFSNIRKSPYNIVKLKHLSNNIVNGLDCRDFIENGLVYLRVSEIKPFEVNLTDTKFINSPDVSKDIFVKEGDLLITRKGSFGFAVVASKQIENSIISSEIFKISLLESRNAKFLELWFNTTFGQKVFDRVKTGGIMGHITQAVLGNLLVPLPPLEIQAQIVAKFEAAYAQKRAKEAEAKKLLAGIDEYLLNKLGIRLPEPTEKKKFFYVRANQVSGGRFDPDYFNVVFSRLRGAIHSGNYPIETLGKICEFISSGKTPAKNEYSDEVTPYPIIKVASYSGDTIDLDKVDYANNPRTFFVKEGDIFVLAAAHQPNYVGRFVKQLNENPTINTSFVGELICLRAQQSSVKSGYLFALLSTNIIKTLLNCEKRGQTSHIYPSDIRKILIPLPPLAVQTEIVEYVGAIRAQAKQREQEAKEIIERAKREVETAILRITPFS